MKPISKYIQKRIVLNHLEQFQTISEISAYEMYEIDNLPYLMGELRNEGFVITTETIQTNLEPITLYRLL